jgi:hypothetical protein
MNLMQGGAQGIFVQLLQETLNRLFYLLSVLIYYLFHGHWLKFMLTLLCGIVSSMDFYMISQIPFPLNLPYSQILDVTLDGSRRPLELSRISVKLNGIQLPTYALNDILVSHPCPASVSRFSFRYFI